VRHTPSRSTMPRSAALRHRPSLRCLSKPPTDPKVAWQTEQCAW